MTYTTGSLCVEFARLFLEQKISEACMWHDNFCASKLAFKLEESLIRNFVFIYKGITYSISFEKSTSGHGGMDSGSPNTWYIKQIGIPSFGNDGEEL